MSLIQRLVNHIMSQTYTSKDTAIPIHGPEATPENHVVRVGFENWSA